mgnify:CR=1 FL=1
MTTSPHVLIFDSGMGGLTVVDELVEAGFAGRVSYAADTGFFPYGDKSDDQLIRRVPAISRALIEAIRPDLFVIACNTASTLALEVTRAVVDVPVVGTVPAIKPAAKATQTGVIGVLATPGTLKRSYTATLVREFARHCTVLTFGSVRLVELAERYAAGEAVSDDELQTELDGMLQQPGADRLDRIVLACTHFPILRDRFVALLPPSVGLVDSGEAIARRVMSLLQLSASSEPVDQRVSRGALWTSGNTVSFARLQAVAARYGFSPVEEIAL